MRSVSILVIFIFLASTCKNTPTTPPPSSSDVELNVNIDPTNAGSVSPNGGTYEEGETVSINATPNNGWQFSNWDGDKSSSNNPLEFTISNNMTITANFTEQSNTFKSQMAVSSGSKSREIRFGLLEQSNVSPGLDGEDLESPPIAPSGAFFTGFKQDKINLYEDYRPLSNEVIWELRLNRDMNSEMNLTWSFINDLENGTLKLVNNLNDSSPSIEVDMLSQSSYSISDPSYQSLFIVYSTTQSKEFILIEIDDRKKGTKQNELKDHLKPSFRKSDKDINEIFK